MSIIHGDDEEAFQEAAKNAMGKIDSARRILARFEQEIQEVSANLLPESPLPDLNPKLGRLDMISIQLDKTIGLLGDL